MFYVLVRAIDHFKFLHTYRFLDLPAVKLDIERLTDFSKVIAFFLIFLLAWNKINLK